MSKILELYLGMLSDEGVKLTKDMAVLEVGCGKGNLLFEMNEKGYNVKGTDLVSYGYEVREDIKNKFLPIIEDPYEIPFPDNSFDFVFSNQVVEHVQDLDVFFKQSSRVLKKGGCSIHVFPSKYRIIEPHINVPFGGVFTSERYYKIWANLGFRYVGQSGTAAEVALENFGLIDKRTNYKTRAQMQVFLKKHFNHYKYIEHSFLRRGFGRASNYLSGISNVIPAISTIYGILHTNVVLLTK